MILGSTPVTHPLPAELHWFAFVCLHARAALLFCERSDVRHNQATTTRESERQPDTKDLLSPIAVLRTDAKFSGHDLGRGGFAVREKTRLSSGRSALPRVFLQKDGATQFRVTP